jgi:hypothetical protein
MHMRLEDGRMRTAFHARALRVAHAVHRKGWQGMSNNEIF